MSGLPRLALQNNKKEEIVRLLQNGADVNEKAKSGGQTALWYACWNNHTEIVQILLQNKKINANLQNNDGSSPFNIASYSSYECALLMLKDARVDINLANTWGWSPLMRACYNGYTKIVQLLISFGRKIDILKKSTKDYYSIKSGLTALDIAKQANNTAVVQLLQQYQNNSKETQKTLRNQLNLKGKKIKYKNNMKKVKTVMK